MKRKDYENPTTMVVKLQHTGMLMESDDREPVRGGSRINNWKDGGTDDEEIYM